jgi:hypothetical protein
LTATIFLTSSSTTDAATMDSNNNNNPKDTAPSESNDAKSVDQQVANTISTTSTPTPQKNVRFQDDLPKSLPFQTGNATTTIPSTQSSTKKTVRFADDMLKSPSSLTRNADPSPTSVTKKIVQSQDASEPPDLPASHFHSLAARLQTAREASSDSLPSSASLNPPPRTDPPRPASHSSSTGFESSQDRSLASSLSAMDVRHWAETDSFATPSHEESGAEVQDDEGEKDEQGNVKIAAQEPCENCGGRIVWATKGEWLMICEKCQEPQ